jgi:hypothetical protein
MNRLVYISMLLILLAGCKDYKPVAKRIAVAKIGNVTLYYDQIPNLIQPDMSDADSIDIIKNYINKWSKKELLDQKAEENLSPEFKDEMSLQLEETRSDLMIYQYQRQMMLQKMDTVISEQEMEEYYSKNEESLKLNSNIVKALYVKIPRETPDIDKARIWCRSNLQTDINQLESYCYQFAEKYDDFNEEWISMNQLAGELPNDILNQEDFLKRTTFFEDRDSLSVYFVSFRDYRLKLSLAPYEYIQDEIKGIILNNRRFEFIKSLEDGIYNEALKNNTIKIY